MSDSAVGDVPVPGDYDGDGKIDFAVWRPGSGTWFVIRSTDGVTTTQSIGSPGDVPVPGRYDADLKTDMAVWTPATWNWTVIRSSDGVSVAQNGGGRETFLFPAIMMQTEKPTLGFGDQAMELGW